MVNNGGFILDELPKYPNKVQAFIGNEEITLAFDESDGTIVEVDSDYEGKAVKIMPYEYDSDDTEIQEIVVKADEFPEACKLVLKSYLKTKKNKVWKNLTITIPEASIASNFSLSTSSEVAPTETEIKLSALSNNGDLMKVALTPLTVDKKEVELTGDIDFATKAFTVYAKDTDGVDDPPYSLFKIDYTRKGELSKVECTVRDKDTGEIFYHETNSTKLTEGNGTFIYSLRKGLADYDTMNQDEKNAIERVNDTIIPNGTEFEVEIKMTDVNGNEKSIIKNYVMSKKDVKMVTI